MPADRDNASEREQQLRDARNSLTRLEVETHRLRARISRLEADHEEETAEALRRRLDETDGRPSGGSEARPDSHAGNLTDEAADGAASLPAIEQPPAENLARRSRRAGRGSGKRPASVRTKPRRVPAKPVRDGGPITAPRISVTKPAVRREADTSGGAHRWSIRALRRRLRKSPSAVSLLLHILLLAAFSLLTITQPADEPFPLLTLLPEAHAEPMVEPPPLELELEQSEPELPLEEIAFVENEPLDLEPLAPIGPAAAGVSLDASPAISLVDPLPAALGEAAAAAGGDGNARSGGESAGAGGANFFGASSQGQRFVYVVDNSGSMQQGRMETTLMELTRSVNSLSQDQMFFVIFFSDQAYPIFYPEPAEEMLPATRRNKRRLARWLSEVELCVGGQIRPAMELAAALRPHVVYLLTDGQMSQSAAELLTAANEWEFAVHTLGMTVRTEEDAARLMAIAAAHQGVFLPVAVHPAIAQAARNRPIKYNREPGPVWGTKVRAR